ncbi:hypothetical protein B0A55_10931, partial [Friedmanniomyces simplex]
MDSDDVGEILADWEALKSRDYARQKLFEQTIKALEVTRAENKILREQKSALETHQNSGQGEWGQERGGHRSREERIGLTNNEEFSDSYVHSKIVFEMTKLVGVYTTAGVVKDQRTMRDFFRGFNEVHPLVEVIDAGDDKEGADTKIKHNITLFAQNEQCKHILLAGSADNGYTGFLRPFALSGTEERRLSLIETIPFPAAFKEVANQFTVVKLPQIFRTNKIKIGESESNNSNEGLHSSVNVMASPIQPKMHFNRASQRLDVDLPHCDPETVDRLKAKKLCNRHYLTNEVHPHVEVIDASDDKEVVDTKIKHNTALFAQNEQCKHILLAGSADNGYTGFLRPFALSGTEERRLSLIETIPFPAAFKEVANQFTVVKLPQIFRTNKIKIGESESNNSNEGLHSSVNVMASPIQPKMHFNRASQRLDVDLPHCDPETVDRLKAKKLCNRHYLT